MMLKLELLLFIALLCMQSESTFFNEPLNMEDMFDMFDDDGCTEGYLTVTDTFGPIISSVLVEEELTESNDSSNITDLLDVKSPLSSINELASFNNIEYLYTLTEEQGPSHKKKFGVSLELGKEKYFGEGSSIKKAQIEAAKLALNSTSYELPPQKSMTDVLPKHIKTPVDKLDSWATNNNYLITYSYVLPSSDENHHDYDSNIYSKISNVVRATVEFENHKYIGEGSSLEEAKQNAASNALNSIYKIEGSCVINGKEKTLIDQIFYSDSENVSPISLLHEFSSKSKLPVSFDIVGEEGPAHLKNYVYQCRVGDDYQSTGEGSSKKAAKRDAAEKMIKHLQSMLPYNSENCKGVTRKKKNKSRAKFVKNVQKIYDDDEEDTRSHVPDNVNPISKLIQIQQAKRDLIPTFTLKEEVGNANKLFYIEVVIGELSFIGSGPNKKMAKRKAAEGMLELMGYSTETGRTASHNIKKRVKAFTHIPRGHSHKRLFPGFALVTVDFNGDEFSSQDNQLLSKKSKPVPSKKSKPVGANDLKDSSTSIKRENEKAKSNDDRKTKVSAMKEFVNVAESMGILFQFNDFPKAKDPGFITLLSLTTRPSRVCYGTGLTTEISQDNAARNALENLYKSRLDSLSRLVRELPSN